MFPFLSVCLSSVDSEQDEGPVDRVEGTASGNHLRAA
jgi:hypothetical protein